MVAKGKQGNGLEEQVWHLDHIDHRSLHCYFCLWDYAKQVVLRVKTDDMDHMNRRIRDAIEIVPPRGAHSDFTNTSKLLLHVSLMFLAFINTE
jgi:hypothetical protein